MYLSTGNIVKLDLTKVKGETPYLQGFSSQGVNYSKDQGEEKQQNTCSSSKKTILKKNRNANMKKGVIN